jgi:pyruvate dehydrogenase E2 component (dihydrolipoamide acetyltransferase)
MGEFRMPSLGADMDAGTIVEWRVQPGDQVHRGDIVAVVDTEKSTIEIEVFEDGVVEALLVEPGVEVAVGTVLAQIAEAGAPVLAPDSGAMARESGARTEGFVRASPRARRRAAAQGVDLGAVAGTGPGGAVVTADLDGGAEPPEPGPPPPPPAEAPPDRQEAMRHAIGALMARSKREIPHYYLAATIDLGAALDWLAEANRDRPVADRLLPAALLLKATALAARENPALNGFWEDGFRPAPAVHLGVAVSLRGGGLVAPAIHDTDQLDVDDLMRSLRDLVQRARAGVLRSSEMADPTITVTNLGDQGVDEVFGVIYPPQVALIGFGRISERPWAEGGLLGVRPLVRATLAGDHRASDGHDGARFLAAVDRLLQAPADL